MRAGSREVVTGRAIDRSVRLQFPVGYLYDTQIIGSPLSVDDVNDPDVLSINGASAALTISDIPWNGPVGAVRLAQNDSGVIINPTNKELLESNLDLLVVSTSDRIVMLEAIASEVDQEAFYEAIELGYQEGQKIVKAINELRQLVGKPKRTYQVAEIKMKMQQEAIRRYSEQVLDILTDTSKRKIESQRSVQPLRERAVHQLQELFPTATPEWAESAFFHVTRYCLHEVVLNRKTRFDGRGFSDLRPMGCEVNLKQPLHGSCMFQRGETQVLTTVALGSARSALKTELMEAAMGGAKEEAFILHYEFPPFCNNTIGPVMQHNRREIGHGNLAERALLHVVPDEFPFTIRLSAQVLESNGSSSMATVCAGSLALMDAAVPVSNAVAGVACGLVCKESDNGDIEEFKLLTDITGIEDGLGDMDFKVAGTRHGITACQLDIKRIKGVTLPIIKESLIAATAAHQEILDVMDKTLSEPRPEGRDNRPIYEIINIPLAKRGRFIGVGGHNLRKLHKDLGIEIDSIDETRFSLFARTQDVMDEAKQWINNVLKDFDFPELKPGVVKSVKIVELRDYGVMVELFPGMQPVLLHVTQMDHYRIYHPSELGFQVGQIIDVKYMGRDPITGKLRISRKAALPLPKQNGIPMTRPLSFKT
ncbi:polyribonucleotide nucleotidyltransferase 1, mitochondrial-like isoform X2 [Corticium candelabrum]|nr:polyribonucleotide nucleotidyltransferase 1, mitochondrial-like isoform X2 [Corticium candelabrum]